MNGFSDDFLWFLNANYPTDFYKVKDEKASPETLASIYANRCEEFRQWETVPLTLRLEYHGKLPEDIKELARQGNYEELRHEAAHKHPEKVDYDNFHPTPQQFASAGAIMVFAAAAAEGYSQASQYGLATERILRDTLRDKAINNTMTATEKEAWRKSKHKTQNIIYQEWKQHSPEKLLVHEFCRFNSGRISAEQLMKQVPDLMNRINFDRRDELLKYIQKDRVQAKLANFDDAVLDMFMQTVLQKNPDELRAMKANALSRMDGQQTPNVTTLTGAKKLGASELSAEQKGTPAVSKDQRLQYVGLMLKQQNVNG